MEQQELFKELPEEPFRLVPETRRDIQKRARAANKELERTAERNRLNRLAKNLQFDFKPLMTLKKIKEAMENGPRRQFLTDGPRQMYKFTLSMDDRLMLNDINSGQWVTEWRRNPDGSIERYSRSGESQMIFRWEQESMK